MQIDKSIFNQKGLYPIYGLLRKPFWQSTAFYIVIISILSLLILICLWILIKKYIIRKYEKTAWQKALFEIDELKKLLLENKVEPKGFYLSLTEIIKRYLYRRYGYDLFGKTDMQVLVFLEKKQFDAELLDSMKTMFQSMQLIKFSKASTVREVMEKDLSRSVDLVNKTTTRQ